MIALNVSPVHCRVISWEQFHIFACSDADFWFSDIDR